MAKIECPICEEDVSSRDAMGLGDSFKRHLMEAHRMTSLACIDMGEGLDPTRGPSREHAATEGSGNRNTVFAGEGESRMERKRESRIWPAGSARSESHIVDLHKPAEDVQVLRERGAYTSERGMDTWGTTSEFMMRCPFCSAVLRADDADRLGSNLKDHWGKEHQIRPTIRAELGMSKSR